MMTHERANIALTLPLELVQSLEIDESTVFCTFFEDGQLFINPLKKEESDCNTIEKRLELEYEDGYQEGLLEGALEGYEDGYKKGYYDASRGMPYRNIYQGRLYDRCTDTTEKEGI